MYELHDDYSTVNENGETVWHTICAQCGSALVLWEPGAGVDYRPEKVDGGFAVYRSRLMFCSPSCVDDWMAGLVEDLHPEQCRVMFCDESPLDGGICLTHINKERASRYLEPAVLCVICNGLFVPSNGEGSCSDECSQEAKRVLNYRRRAREADAFVEDVNRQAIYERDDYTCQLCGGEIDMSLEFPHRMFPTIDHVIPLAAGGTHEPGNVQAAHFGCNSAKGARV